ncbi:MAG: hypothetical protein SGILL_004894 [Bacillariaceae sp.]
MSSTDEFLVGPVIGHGGFAHVVYAVHKHSQRKVAIKVIEQVSLRKHPWLLQAVMTEKRILQSSTRNDDNETETLQSQYMVELWAAFYDAQQMYLVMELCTGGDLEGLLHQVGLVDGGDKGRRIPAEDATLRSWFELSVPYYASQLVEAVNFLHTEKSILHCDLKPGNCLLDALTGRLKLADFASAIEMNALNQTLVPRGTSEYSSLELIRSVSPSSLTVAVDYWSVGCILYAMTQAGKSPFARESESLAVQAVAEYCKEEGPSSLPAASPREEQCQEWLMFSTQLLQPQPGDRLRAWKDEILNSEALKQGNPADLSLIELPTPTWQRKVESTTLKDGNIGWSAFHAF